MMDWLTAHDILQKCSVRIDDDWFTLNTDQKLAIVEQAKKAKYSKPKRANGSTGRYFHAYLQRRAARKELDG